jgi:hypothetical protein
MQAAQSRQGVWVVLNAVLLALASPGMVAVYWVNRVLTLSLQRGQLWTVAILTSLLLFGSAAATSRTVLGGLVRYALACLLVIGVLAVSYYGFAAEWPTQMWRQYFS